MIGWLRQRCQSDPRRFWTGAFALWLCIVWGHSLMSGDISSLESSRFVFLVRPIFNLFGCNDEVLMTFAIRKTAHFCEYAVLMILASRMVRAWFGFTNKSWVVLVLIWVSAPCIDEGIQTLIPGRAGQPADVLLDMAGGLTGVLVALAIGKGMERMSTH